jgi:hypothetical protein
VAVISQTAAAKPGPVTAAAAAIQKQVNDHFAPEWDCSATVSYFPSLNEMPQDYWPVVIRDTTGISADGAHVSRDGQFAFAVIAYHPEDWTVTLSHEILELLADPFGTSFVSGPSPDDDGTEVQFLTEVCDPCQGAEPDPSFAYPIDGIPVSDFVFKAYYSANAPGQYSFAGHVTGPRQLLPWGYYTWFDPGSRTWSWRYADDNTAKSEPLGQVLPRPDIHLRGFIDRKVEALLAERGRPSGGKARRRVGPSRAARTATAAWWQEEIDAVAGKRPARGK